MPDAPAQVIKKQQIVNVITPLEPITWDQLPENVRSEFFENIESPAALDTLLNHYEKEFGMKGFRFENINIDEIKFQHFIETSIKEKDKPEEQHEEKHQKQHKGGHGGHGHGREIDMLTQEMQNNIKYKEILEELQKKKTKNDKWEKEKVKISESWKKDNKKLANSPAGQKALAKHLEEHAANPDSYATRKEAEAMFRKQHKNLAKDYDKKEIQNTSKSFENDHVGKQYLKFAHEDAEHEIKQKLTKKLKNGKITEAEFREQSNVIHKKHQESQTKAYAANYWHKAYEQQKTSPILQKPVKEVGFGRASRYYKKKQKEENAASMKVAESHLSEQEKEALKKIKEKQKKEIQVNKKQPTTPKEENERKPSVIDRVNNLVDRWKQFRQMQQSPEQAVQEFTPEEPSFGELGTEGISEEVAGEAGLEAVGAEAAGTEATMAASATTGTAVATAPTAAVAALPTATAGTAGTIETLALFESNPVGWVITVVIIVVLLVILIAIIVFVILNQPQNNQNQTDTTVPGLTINLTTNTPTVANGDNQMANYTVIVTCDTTCQQQEPINIFIDPLPQGTTVVNAAPQFTTTPHPVTWPLAANTPTATITFSLNTTTQINDTKIGLTVQGESVSGGTNANANTAAIGTIANIPQTKNDCGGKYTYYMSITPGGNNYGDPNCDFTNDLLATIINGVETNNDTGPGVADRQKCFFFVIAKWESEYNANAYLGASTSTLGAYGLFQMNPASAGHQAVFDVGDVYWKLQTENAVKNNVLHGNHFAYWDPRTLAHDTNGWCHP